ncbi:xanthine dehydrogenase family protein molybdopterin-binding subunit [Rhodobacteraceae bacterium WD3A24]|nr:xanthine dehydrogenase family protein molybdopterin-binding subunit [Rhodobacteraceae bacterium WD3A24]
MKDDTTNRPTDLSRRGFLATTGGATFALTFLPGPGAIARAEGHAGRVNAWVHVATDGRITIHAPAAEMGQGVQTVVPMIVAEELDADWDDVSVETAPVDPAFNHPIFRGQYTVASLTVRGYWMPARLAGAQVRRALMMAAAEHWGVALDDLATEPGAVIGPDGRRMGYGEIVATAAIPGTPPEVAPEELKPVSEFRLLGHDRARVDVADKSSGAATYAADIRQEGMLYATVARAPVTGQSVGAHNGDEIAAMDGIEAVVDLGHGVAVVGASTAQVFAARRALDITWSGTPDGTRIDSERDQGEYLARLRDEGQAADKLFSSSGEAEAALEAAHEVVSREFVTEYCYHAQMEPMGGVALVNDDSAEVWTGTQWQTMALNKTVAATGLDPAQVTVHQLFMGGGFGRRAHTEYIDDVVAIASELRGRPVKLLLSREDDVASARLRPLTAQRVQMGLDEAGRIVALRHAVACQPVAPYMYGQARWEADEGADIITMRGSSMPHYAVPDQMAEHYYEMRGARVAAWRGIGAGYTKFAHETMIDEIARMRGVDPLDYRRQMASSDRVRELLDHVAGMADWGEARAEGRALGLAFAEYGASLAAAVAEISLDRESGRISAHNIWAAADAGLALQPDNIRAQMEGGMTFGLSAALKEEVTLRAGRIEQSNFSDYQVMRMAEMPEIVVDVLQGDDSPTEVGELGLPVVAPAIANAFLALTGRTVNHLPMTPERIRAVLEA